jgi:ribosomal protein S9
LNTAAKVQVVVTSRNPTINVPLGDDIWLLFKLSGKRLEQGRMVKHVSSGSYLAIVPDTWQRDEEKAGSPPTTAEPVFLEGYRAHFFELTESGSSCIAFLDELGQSITIGSSGAGFHLIGHEIHDDRERVGPLFGGAPPRLGIENGHWSDVETIVVGQEGSGRQRWRKRFEPKAHRPQQELPHEVLERKAGWYFIRFYASTDTLIDSLDFRFVAGLKEISIPMARPVPSPEGHVAQTVEIVHDSGYSIRKLVEGCPGLEVEYGSEKTILRIPPRADYDRTRWVIQPPNNDGQEVEFAILIERLWWALGSNDTEPSQWGDRLVSLSRRDFTAASDRAVWMRLPKPRWASAAYAGFRRESARRFPIKVTDKTVHIPLRDFSGVQELADQGGWHQFKVWLETGRGTHEITVAILSAVARVMPVVPKLGRYKTAIAEARLQTGSGKINVNGVLVGQYFSRAPQKARFFLRKLCALPEVKQTLSKLDVDVTVRGSRAETIRQAKAVVHAIARALWSYDSTLMRPLKQAGFGGASVTEKHRAYGVRRVNDESR